MSFDAFVGDVGTDWALTARAGGTTVDLAGAVVELAIENASGMTAFQDPSQFAITNASSGSFTFSPATGEVDTAGEWLLQPFVSVGGYDFACDPIRWMVGP